MQSANQSKDNKLAIIAGRGDLPVLLLKSLAEKPVVIGFASDKNAEIQPDLQVNLAQIGKVIAFLRKKNATHIVFAGGIKRPKIIDLRPDWLGFRLLLKVCFSTFFCKLAGDNKLFSTMAAELEKNGVLLVGAHEILPELLAQEMCYGQLQPNAVQLQNIQLGMAEAKRLGEQDLGQAVIVANGEIVAREDFRGTAAMLADWQGKFAPADNAVLVKCKKPQQDARIDLPSIGVATVEQAQAAGLCGIAIEAGAALVIDAAECATAADQARVFVVGVK